jgi:hypothetical protein
MNRQLNKGSGRIPDVRCPVTFVVGGLSFPGTLQGRAFQTRRQSTVYPSIRPGDSLRKAG